MLVLLLSLYHLFTELANQQQTQISCIKSIQMPHEMVENVSWGAAKQFQELSLLFSQ